MKKLIAILSILIIGLIIGSVAFANAQRGPRNSKMRPDVLFLLERHSDEIGLTEEQESEIKAVHFDSQKEVIGLKAELEIAELELRQLMDEDEPDEAEVYRKIDGMGTLKTEIHKKRIANKLAVKSILSEEQEEKLKKIRHQKMKERREDVRPRQPQPNRMD